MLSSQLGPGKHYGLGLDSENTLLAICCHYDPSQLALSHGKLIFLVFFIFKRSDSGWALMWHGP